MNVAQEFNPETFSAAVGGSQRAFLQEYNLTERGSQIEDDAGVHVEFFIDKVLLGFKSKQEGREIYEDREFVSIRIKGQDKTNFVAEVTQEHAKRFPRAYAAFKANVTQAKRGTPIERLPGVSPSNVYMFKQMNITTVEDLSEVADQYLQNLGPGARELQLRAKEFLANGKIANEETARQLKEAQVALAEAVALINAMKAEREAAETKRGPGRPPKQPEAAQDAS